MAKLKKLNDTKASEMIEIDKNRIANVWEKSEVLYEGYFPSIDVNEESMKFERK